MGSVPHCFFMISARRGPHPPQCAHWGTFPKGEGLFIADVLVDAFRRRFAGAHGEDYGGGAGDRVAAGEDAGTGGHAALIGLNAAFLGELQTRGGVAEDPVLYLNDCALCFTDDPIAIVLFTTGTENAYAVLTDYCTLMCDYAQETHEKRVEREQAEAKALAEAEERDRLAAEEAAAAEAAKEAEAKTEQTPEVKETPEASKKEASKTTTRSLPTGTLICIALIFLGALGALIWFSIWHRKSRFRMFYGVLVILLTVAALVVCFPAVSGKSYIASDEEGARDTVEQFFDLLKKGDYDSAEKCFSGRMELDGQRGSEDSLRDRTVDALRESWNFRLLGDCVTEKTNAWQEVQIQVLDFSKMEEDLQRGIREQLLEMTRTTERSQIFDEAGDYRPEVAEKAYDAALSELLKHPEDYYGSAGVRVQLRLTQDGWKVVPTKDLMNILSGNMQQL